MSLKEPEPKHIKEMTSEELADLADRGINLGAAQKIFDELDGDEMIVAHFDPTGRKLPEAQIIKKTV